MAEHRNGNGSGGGNAYAINLENFTKRLKAFYSHWIEHKTDLWSSSDSLVIATPSASKDLRYLKSSALNEWLFGFEFPETIIVFMNKQIHFLCSQKKASLLEVLRNSIKKTLGAETVMHVKPKRDDGTVLMDAIFSAIHAQAKSSGQRSPIVGHIAKEAPEGSLLESWAEKLTSSGLQLTDVTNGFADLFALKDTTELMNVKKAAFLTSSVMEYFVVPKLEKIIDEEKKVSHSSLMDATEKAILEPARVKVNLKAENVGICYPPIFRSGGEFDLKLSVPSNDENLYYDSTGIIVCAIGSRYNCYCSNVARTFLIDANAMQRKAYEVLLKAHEAAIGALKPGNKVSAAYEEALSVVDRDGPEFAPHLTKSAGSGIGLEFRESGLSLNAKNNRLLKAGMVFNVSLGFQNLQAQTINPKTERFSLLLADTVIIKEKAPEVVTAVSSKAVKDVAYSVNEDDKEEVEKPKDKAESISTETFSLKATLRSDHQEMSKEEIRRQHQAELAIQKNEETRRRLAGIGSAAGDGRGSVQSASDLVAYKNVKDVPPSRKLMIQIDKKNEAVILPISGDMVPFHIATIKNVTSLQDSIRVIFNIPGPPFSPHDAKTLKFQELIYLKEVSFRNKDVRHSNEVVQVIKTFRRQVKSRESERAERATLVTQEKLQLAGNKFKPIRLFGILVRPTLGGRGRKLTGTLEAHVNGFRYSTSRPDERVDIMYENVKHAIFQPAEKEMITVLHFHLHNHIMVGNKKTKDVQFYVEVMDVVQNLGGGKRYANDPDEIEEEQRERDKKNKINMDFQTFVNKVNDLWGQAQFRELDLEFDQPMRELGFHGVPHKAAAFIVPCSSCLVELIETPFLVVTLSEIQIVNLERVELGQKSFDMTIVFKDLKRDVLRIDSIPSTSLDCIKEWLDTADLKYYESRLNLNWKNILKGFIDNPKKFIKIGGWEFLNMEASDSESENSEDSDQGYEPSDVESDSASEEEEEDDDSESMVESEDDDEEDKEEESEEEKGKTWEELEREASNADKENEAESDSEDERKRRKMKAFGKSRVPHRRDQRSAPSKRAKLR